MTSMHFIGLDIHKKTISYCVKDVSGKVLSEGTVLATRIHLDQWMKTLPVPWTVAMEATMFTGWIYDHLLPQAAAVKVAHPLMLRAIAAARRRTTASMQARFAIACDATSCPSAIWFPLRSGNAAGHSAIANCWSGRTCSYATRSRRC